MVHQAVVIVGVVASVAAVVGVAGLVIGFLFKKKAPKYTLIDNAVKVPLRLVDRQSISPDTIRIKLALTSPEHLAGIPVGGHCYLSARIDGSMVVRPYTPVSMTSQEGYMDFVIKVYAAGVNPKFPNGGKMSQYISKLPLNQYIDVRGPAGLLNYKGNGQLEIKPDERSPAVARKVKTINMSCGGSGITPMFQLLSHILNDADDTTKLALLYANNTERDILLRDELEQLQRDYSNQFRLWYTVTEEPPHWNYSTGYIDEKMISEHIYPPGEDSIVLLCGPPPMLEVACYPHLAKLNYSREHIFAY